MWIEAILTKEDLALVLRQLTPLRVQIGADETGPERVVYVGRPSHVELVPGAGLRFVARAKIRWEILGVKVPIEIASVQVLLSPRIDRKDGHDQLAFRLRIEDADLSALPDFLDQAVVRIVNRAIKGAETDMAWDFIKTLSFNFNLPDAMRPIDRFDLRASWGEVKVTEEAIVLAVSFKSRIPRGNAPTPGPDDDGLDHLTEEEMDEAAAEARKSSGDAKALSDGAAAAE